MEFYRLMDLQELNLSGEELSWNVTWKLSNCTGIEWMHQRRNMNGMIPLWDFNSKALVTVPVTARSTAFIGVTTLGLYLRKDLQPEKASLQVL